MWKMCKYVHRKGAETLSTSQAQDHAFSKSRIFFDDIETFEERPICRRQEILSKLGFELFFDLQSLRGLKF